MSSFLSILKVSKFKIRFSLFDCACAFIFHDHTISSHISDILSNSRNFTCMKLFSIFCVVFRLSFFAREVVSRTGSIIGDEELVASMHPIQWPYESVLDLMIFFTSCTGVSLYLLNSFRILYSLGWMCKHNLHFFLGRSVVVIIGWFLYCRLP